MPLHETMPAALIAAERLLLPVTIEKYWAQTYTLTKIPAEITTFSASVSSMGGVYNDVITLAVCFPESWGFDTTWRNLNLRLSVAARVTNDDGADSGDYSVRFKSGAETTATTGTLSTVPSGDSERVRFTKLYTTIPTGVTEEIIEAINNDGDADAMTLDRTPESGGQTINFGPDCFYEFVEV